MEKLSLPASIKIRLSEDQQNIILTGLNKIILGLKLAKSSNSAALPAQETKRIRQDLKSIERHLSAIAGLLEDDRVNGIMEKFSDDECLLNTLKSYQDAAHRAVAVKPVLYYSSGMVPAMVASDIEKLMLQAEMKPTRTINGVWAKLFKLAYVSAGYEIKKDLFKNSIKRQGKNCDENIPKLP